MSNTYPSQSKVGFQQSKSKKKSCKPTYNPKKKATTRSAKKNTIVQQDDDINLYFVALEKAERNFLDGTRFACPPENLNVHIFYAKDTPASELPRPAKWIIGHESLTQSKDAMWIDLTAYIISLYARISAGNNKSAKCSKSAARANIKIALICADEEKGAELTALLKANKADISIIDGRKNVFLDMFKHVCRSCKLIFHNKAQAEDHDRVEHNFRCHNIQCERSRRGNGFYTREELESHLRAQRFCRFCPSDVFCTESMQNRHIQDNHTRCPCACQEYYEREEDLFEQYYAKYPLPCLEEPACEARFKDIEAQAFHHKSAHGAKYPYFCMACFKTEKLVCLETAEKLLKHVSTMKHTNKDFQFAIIPEKIIQGSGK